MPGVWKHPETAPKDGRVVEVLVQGSSRTWKVRFEDGFVDTEDQPCGCWVVLDTNFGEPPGWSDGVCWRVNADGEPSAPILAWRELAGPVAAYDEEDQEWRIR